MDARKLTSHQSADQPGIVTVNEIIRGFSGYT